MSAEANQQEGFLVALLGALLSTAALISYFTVPVQLPGLHDTAWLNLGAMAAGLTLSVIAFARRSSLWSKTSLALSILWSVALVMFVFVFSNQLPSPDGTVAVGQAAPSFELPDQDGRQVALSDFHGSTVVLVFYRGFW
jgi:hypothetical protein